MRPSRAAFPRPPQDDESSSSQPKPRRWAISPLPRGREPALGLDPRGFRPTREARRVAGRVRVNRFHGFAPLIARALRSSSEAVAHRKCARVLSPRGERKMGVRLPWVRPSRAASRPTQDDEFRSSRANRCIPSRRGPTRQTGRSANTCRWWRSRGSISPRSSSSLRSSWPRSTWFPCPASRRRPPRPW